MTDIDLVNNRWGDRTVEAQIRRIFESDGTVYLVSGFFTYNAYHALRPDVEAFLERSPDNELVVVVGAAADQFAPDIARDLRELAAERPGSVQLYKYPDGFLHAKLYLRTGPDPHVIVGSANLTQVAFEQNLELSVAVEGDGPDDERIEPFVDWIDGLLAVCEPIRRRDLSRPVMVYNTVANWINKGRLLPSRAVFHQRISYVTLAAVVLFFWIAAMG